MADFLSRDDLLSKPELSIHECDVPGWGLVRIRELSVAELDEWENSNIPEAQPERNGKTKKAKKSQFDNFRARLVVRCLCDAAGNRLLSDADAELLGKKPAAAVDAIFAMCRDVNGMTRAAQDAIRKNSESAGEEAGDSASA